MSTLSGAGSPVKDACLLQDIPQINIGIKEIWVQCHCLRRKTSDNMRIGQDTRVSKKNTCKNGN